MIQHNNCHVGTCVVPIILNNFEVLKNEKWKNFARLSGSRLGACRLNKQPNSAQSRLKFKTAACYDC